jgi:hypothetical protein
MRDKYNLNTLPPGHEEDYGNIADLAAGGGVGGGLSSAMESRSGSLLPGFGGPPPHAAAPVLPIIPGMAPEDKVQQCVFDDFY